jgi:hypothetical protein
MLLPEYGRSIQDMVDYCCTIADRDERQRCANSIITIMGNLFPQLRDVPDFKHKLWDHLAIMSDFKLDIDYPYEVIRPDTIDVKPDAIPYPQRKIRYRHYGRIVADLIQKACDMPEGEERDSLVALICNHLRKDYVLWNKEGITEDIIDKDLAEYSEGKLHINDHILELMQERQAYFGRPAPERKPNNNQKGGSKRRNYKK